MANEPTTADIRAWAQKQGIDVAERGRIAAEVREAYDVAHKTPRQRPAPPAKPAPAPAQAPAPARAAAPVAAPARSEEPSKPGLEERLANAERRITALEEQLRQVSADSARGGLFGRRRRQP